MPLERRGKWDRERNSDAIREIWVSPQGPYPPTCPYSLQHSAKVVIGDLDTAAAARTADSIIKIGG